jgi:hypothetical protein
LAFVHIVEQWPGDQSFAGYLLGYFRWELLNTIQAGQRLNEEANWAGSDHHL